VGTLGAIDVIILLIDPRPRNVRAVIGISARTVAPADANIEEGEDDYDYGCEKLLGILSFFRNLFGSKRTLDELIQAVDDEIAWLKKRGSGKRVTIRDGKKRNEVAGKYYYSFKLDEELKGLYDDTPIELIIGRDATTGVLVSITPNEIVIAVDQDLGDRIESANLLSQPVFILVALRNRLVKSKSMNRRLSEDVLNGRIRQTDSKSAHLSQADSNEFQRLAITKAGTQTVSYIWGPPGTGKTWTIALLTYSFLQNGCRTLIVSNTNAAVDRAVQLLSKVLPQQTVIRLGSLTTGLSSNVINPDVDKDVAPPEEWKIVCTTFAKSFLDQRLQAGQFDVVVVDEASMAQIPSVYHSALFAREHVVIVGDFEQLPPISMNKDSKMVQKWMVRDVFENVGIASNPLAFMNQGKLVMLRRQYRMNPQISAMINQLVYRGQLEDSKEVCAAPKVNIEPCPESALVLVDTTELHPWCKKSPTSSSKYNLYHAFLAVDLAEKVLRQGRTPGIITPYAEQAHRIRLMLRDKGLEDRILASTVHRFQGQEVDTVIYDISDSEGTAPRWLESETSKRLMNVAFSRAQRKLIIIANKNFITQRLPNDNVARQAIRYIQEKGRIVAGGSFLPPEFQIKDPSARTLQPEEYEALKDSQVTAFTERTFYPAFMSDIQHARREVLLFSPFITERRLGLLAEDLKALIQRGVKVSIYTRPPDQMFDVTEEKLDRNLTRGASDSINYLKSIGASVEIRPQMHEKIAAIDLKTWWVGSLNILSHAYTRETMIRFQGLEKTIQNLIDEILQRRSIRETYTAKVGQLKDGMKGLRVEGRIMAVSSPRKVGGGKRIADAFLSDGSGTIKLVLWEDQINLVKEGIAVVIENGYVTSFRGNLQLNLGRYGKISRALQKGARISQV